LSTMLPITNLPTSHPFGYNLYTVMIPLTHLEAR
jgi:hypothetical protein